MASHDSMGRVLSIEQTEMVDFISIDDASGRVWLSISDHLPWSESGHLLLLQDKLNSYLRFIESGELLQKAPDASGRPVVINLVCKYEPGLQGSAYLDRAANAIRNAGFDLRVQLKLSN